MGGLIRLKFGVSVVALIGMICIAGCQGAKPAETSGAETAVAQAKSPAEKLQSQLSSGQYQLGAALDSLEQAHDLSQKLLKPGTHLEALKEMADFLDSSGRLLADVQADTPPTSTIAGDFAAYDESRLAAIVACNDALHDINDAQGILASVLQELGADRLSDAEKLHDNLTATMDDIIGTIDAFGGEVEND